MKYNLKFKDSIVLEGISAKNENHAWNILRRMGIYNKSNIYNLVGDECDKKEKCYYGRV